ncbi:MAG: hypothetical protein V1723_02865 [Candidatus Uhrbacteria bacterium]
MKRGRGFVCGIVLVLAAGCSAIGADTGTAEQSNGVASLVVAHDDVGAEPITYASIGIAQTHCHEAYMGFAAAAVDCAIREAAHLTVEVLLVQNGPGDYVAQDAPVRCERTNRGEILGPPPGQEPFAANVWYRGTPDATPIPGAGIVRISSGAIFDRSPWNGVVDVLFNDGGTPRRLLSKFDAGLCATE